MEKFMLKLFKFPNGNLFCVGAESSINDFLNHFYAIKEQDRNMELPAIYNRVIANKIYCRFEPKNFHGLRIFINFYFKLKKEGLWISGTAVDDAIFCSNPAAIKESLKLTDEQVQQLKEKSMWSKKFKLD